MKKLFLLIAVLIIAVNTSESQIKITGNIKDEKGIPVNGANVVLQGTIDGATSDEKGNYEFETDKAGNFKLICTFIGFSDYLKEIIIGNENLVVNIILNQQEYTTDEIIVTASSFVSGENTKVTLTPIEIVRIPGADADLYRAITTFPGSNQVDEGSRIAVRGGDPNEVLTFLDYASLYNPFIFQDAYNTQSFSTINPWGLKGINFSSGGFSAKYGNVLSAVLDLQSYDMPNNTGIFAFLGMANASMQGTYISNNGKFGASFAGYQVYVKPFLELNGIKEDFSHFPTATGLGGTLVYKTSKTGVLKLYGNYDQSKVGINAKTPSFTGYNTNEANTYFTNLKYSFSPTSESQMNFSLSLSKYDSKMLFAILDNKSENLYSKFRADYFTPINGEMNLSGGIEYEYNEQKLSGKFPAYYYNLRPDAASFNLNMKENTKRAGAYTELQWKAADNFAIIGGIRSDYHTINNKLVIDPRLSVVYRFSEHSYFKAAAGIYHQNPQLNYFIQSGISSLTPEEAIHYILGYEYNRDADFIFRVEAYYKDYKKLVLFDRFLQNFSSEGFGYAKGIDVFLKVRLVPKFNGWISYSLTDSRRKQFEALEISDANYDITHSMSIVTEYNFTDFLTAGASFKISTGKPYTPALGGILDSAQNVYIPIYGQLNSGRMPVYTRLDMNLQYVFNFLNNFAVAVLAINNILNQNNLLGYTYTPDYRERIDVSFNSPRIIYIGFGVQF